MDRRTFLGTAVTAIALPLAGCTQPTGGSLSIEPLPDDAAIGGRYAGSTENLAPERRTLVEAAIAGESPTREGRRPPYEASRPLEHEGAIYEITHEVVDTRTAIRYTIQVDYDPATTPESVIGYDRLPDADRRALDGQIPPGDDPPTGEGFDLDSTSRYPADFESILVPEPEYEGISYEGSIYRIGIRENREVTMETYAYDAERIADGTADLGTQLRERHLFELTDVSAEEAEVLESAREIYQPDEEEVPDAFRSLADRFRDQEPLDEFEDGGQWLIRYDGTVYWVNLEYPPEPDT